jgi:hypothetical protein
MNPPSTIQPPLRAHSRAPRMPLGHRPNGTSPCLPASRQRVNMLACALLDCLSAPYLIGGVVRSVQAHIDVAICPIEVPELARQGADLT